MRFRLLATATAAAVATTTLIVALPRSSVAADPVDIRQVSASTAGAVISGDGRFVAAQTSINGPQDKIALHDQLNRQDETITPDGFRALSRPEMSSDGNLVAFAASDAVTGTQIHVVDRSRKGPPHQITGTASDLEFQRMQACRSAGSPGGQLDCGPRISRDGTTVVFPARLEARSPLLRIEVDGANLDRDHPFVDLDSGTPQAHLTMRANRRLTFTTAPSITGPDAAAFSSTSTCTGELSAGQTCTADVRLNTTTPACTTFFAALETRGTTQDARTIVPLVGESDCAAPPPPPPPRFAAADCADIAPGRDGRDGTLRTSNAGNPVATQLSVPLGQSGFTSILVSNDDPQTSVALQLDTPDCAFDLFIPEQPGDGPPPCDPDSLLETGDSCTAYVAFRGPQVGPFAATLRLFRENGTSLDTSYRFEGTTAQDVLLTRTDPSGAGDFAGAGRAAPSIVNLGINGSIVDAEDPALSGDGRFVAYQTIEAGRTRILRLDRSNGSVAEVSLMDNEQPSADDAIEPALSRSGQRVAFVTHTDGASQVWVRDLDSGRTVLASGKAEDPDVETTGHSRRPALSGDGTTVAFSSTAQGLTADEIDSSAIFARNLEPDFTGAGERGSELVSVRPDGTTVPGVASFQPTLDEFGAYVAFQATGALVASGSAGVYVARRAGNVGADPAALDYGRLPVGATGGPLAIQVANTGRGAVELAPGRVTGPYRVESNDCGVLRRDESCTVTISFRPGKGGLAPGALTIGTRQGFAVQEPLSVPLSGFGVDPDVPVAALSVSPARVAFAEHALSTLSPVRRVVVRNVGSVPLRVTASGTSLEFPVTTRCAVLAVGASCSVDVRFRPTNAGARSGAIQVRGTATAAGVPAPAPATIALTGTTAAPVLTVEPFLIRPGRTASATGTGFAPNTEVTLTWSQGNGTGTARTDAEGNFTVPVLVVRRDILGSRELIASTTGNLQVRSAPVLVIPRTGQPPTFLSRG